MELRKEDANKIITSLREEYKVFDESLPQSDDYHHRDVLKAYLQEAKYGISNYSQRFILDGIEYNEAASKLNKLIVKSLKSGSANFSKSKVEILSILFDTKKWGELSKQIGIFEDAIADINIEAFKKSTNREINRVCELKNIENTDRFQLYLMLKVIGVIVAAKNAKSPLTYEVIVGGIIDSRSIIVKSTFNSKIKDADRDNPSEFTLKLMEVITDIDLDPLLNLASEYRLDNYMSKRLEDLHELAISARKFEGVDYAAIADTAEVFLNMGIIGHSITTISEEKVIMFLAAADSYTKQQVFKDIKPPDTYKNIKGDAFFVNSSIISKYIGDVKVVRAIKDSLLSHGILKVKSKYLPEIKKTNYELLVNLDVCTYYVVKAPILLRKIKNEIIISYTLSIDNKLLLLERVMYAAESLKYNVISNNYLEIYIESSKYGELWDFVNLAKSLKRVILKNGHTGVVPKYYNAVKELSMEDAKMIYIKIYFMVDKVISDILKYGYTDLYLPTFRDDGKFESIKKFNKALLKLIKE